MSMQAVEHATRDGRAARYGTDGVLTIVVLIVGLLLPYLVGAGQIPTLVAGLFALQLAYSWNIVGGILGELSLVHMIFWGAGGYALVLALGHHSPWELWVAVAVVGSAVGAVLLISVATALRLVGLYLAVFTLIVHEISHSVVTKIAFLGAGVGLYVTGSQFWTQTQTYYAAFGLVILVCGINFLILHRPVGLRWLTLRDDPVAAQAIGVNPNREKSIAYATSAMLAVLGGALQAYYLGYVQPDATFSLAALIAAILAVYVGGPGTMWGPLTGVLVVFGIGQVATAYSTSANVALYAQLLQYLASFLVIRFITSRLAAGDLLSLLVERALRLVQRPASSSGDAQEAAATSAARRLILVSSAGADTADPAAASGAAEPPLLSAHEIAKDFGGLQVLRGVSCDLAPRTITALVGPNGAGKTTLCNILSGFISPTGGTVSLVGEDISSLPPYARFRLGIGRTFQTPRLCDRLTLEQNVAAAAAGDMSRARRALERVGVFDSRKLAGASTLYERRLTEVARAVVGAERVVLLDEPLVGLAHDQQQATLALLRDLANDGLAILIVEHLIPVVAPAADRMIVLVGGKLIADGKPADALGRPEVIDAYLGEPIGLSA